MAVDPLSLLLVLAAALVQAGYETTVKMSGDQIACRAMVCLVGLGLGIAAIPFLEAPPLSMWLYLVLSSIAQTACYLLSAHAYALGELSVVYPTIRGTTVSTCLVLSYALTGADISAAVMIGVACIVAGVAMTSRRGVFADGRNMTLWSQMSAIGSGLAVAGFLTVDGMAVQHFSQTYTYMAWSIIIGGLPLICIAIVTRRASVVAVLQANGVRGLYAGLLSMTAYGLILVAFSRSDFGIIVAMREVSAVLICISGWFYLKETLSTMRLLGVFLTMGGVVTLVL